MNRYPGPGPAAPIDPGSLDSAYPAVGLAGLAQGFTNGLQLGHEWGHQAEELQAKKDQMANEAGWRETQAKQAADWHAGELKNRADMISFMKDQAGKIGTPVLDADGNVVGYQTGKGGITKAAVPKPDKNASSLGMIDSLEEKWKALDTGKSTLGATARGGVLKTESLFPSTNAGQYADLSKQFAGKMDHDLLGRVNDVTIKSAHAAVPGMFDTPESAAQKWEFIRGIYKQAGIQPPSAAGEDATIAPKMTAQTGASDVHAQAVAWARANPRDPRSATILKLNGQ